MKVKIDELKNITKMYYGLRYGEDKWCDIEVFEPDTNEFVGFIHKDSTGFKYQCNINYKGVVKKLATRCNFITALNLIGKEYNSLRNNISLMA